jgi:hypothetical protein
MDGMNMLAVLDHYQSEEDSPRQGAANPDSWRGGTGRCKSGSHEPARCTKICTNPLRLALGWPSANLRLES